MYHHLVNTNRDIKRKYNKDTDSTVYTTEYRSKRNQIEKSKKDGKDQKMIQSSTTPDPGYHMGK